MTRAVHITVFFFFLLAVQSVTGTIQVTRHPDGAYCGDYIGLVKGRITAGESADTFDIWLDAFGDVYNCKGEKYTFDERTSMITIPGATDPNDCLGKLLVQNTLSLSVTYSPKYDTLYVDLGIVRLKLTQCL